MGKISYIHNYCLLFFVIIFCLANAQNSYGIPILKDQAKHKAYSTSVSLVRKSVKAKARQLRKRIGAKSAIIIKSHDESTIFAKSPDLTRQPASTIKIITGLIAINSLKKTDKIRVSKKAARQPRSKIYLSRKKRYTANDLINAVLLASANDASVAVAERVAGSERKFAKQMTNYAKKHGAKNTICKTASGLTATGQKSTPRDLAKFFNYAMENRDFAKRMKVKKVRSSLGKDIYSHNRALWQIKGALGGKTGYTHAAKKTYVGKFKRGNKEIVVALMGTNNIWTDLKKLVKFGFENY